MKTKDTKFKQTIHYDAMSNAAAALEAVEDVWGRTGSADRCGGIFCQMTKNGHGKIIIIGSYIPPAAALKIKKIIQKCWNDEI